MAEKKYILGMELNQLRRDKEKAKSLFSDLGRDVERTGKQIDGTYFSIGKTVAGAFSIAAITSFGKQLIDVAGQFQTFRAVLTNTLGDPLKAGNAMEMIQEFAATTPFQVDALTGSFVKLANQGFTPTMQQMTLLGDLASSTGKGFDQLTEAIIDAQTGEFERLKEFGIRASKEGENVTFTFKEQQTQVDFTASSIRDYILSLGELEGVQGANAAIAATLTGQVSNLQDSITQMMNEVGQSSSGALSGAISGASYLVEHYEEVGKALGVLITMYGTYKAATLAIVAGRSVITSARYAAEIVELQKLIAVKEVEKNADLQKLVIDGKMTAAQAEKIASLRAEAQARLDALKATAAQAQAEMQSAQTTINNNNKRIATIDAEIAKQKAKLASMTQLQNSEALTQLQGEKSVLLAEQKKAQEVSLTLLLEKKAKTAEIASLVEQNASKEAIAAKKAELAIINASIKSNNTESASISKNVVAKNTEIQTVKAQTTAKEFNTAQGKLNRLETDRNTLSESNNTAQKNINSLAVKKDTAETAANTLQQNINTASTKAGVTAQKLFAFATSGVTKAFKSLKLAFASNPIGLLITILTTAASAWLMFKDNADDASESQDKFNDSVKDAMSSICAEQTEIDLLFKSLKSAKKGTDEYNAARTTIQNKYGQYLSNMSEEVRSLNDVATAYKLISERAIQSAKDRAVAEITSQKSADYAAEEMQSVNKMMEYFSRSGLNGSQSSTVVSAIMKSFRTGTEMSEKDIKYIDTLLRKTFKDMTAYGAGSVTADGTEVYDFWIGGMLESLGNAKSKLSTEIESINKIMSAGLSGGGSTPDATLNYGEEYQAARKAWEDAKKGLKEVEDDRNKFTTEVYNNRAKAEAEAKKKFEALGGDTSSKSINPVTDDEKQLVKYSIGWYEAQITKLKDIRKSLTDASEIIKVDKNIRQMQVAMGILEDETNVENIDKEASSMTDEYTKREGEAYKLRLANYKTFTERYQELEKEHISNLKLISAKGGTQADIDAEDQSYEDSLKSLNDEVLATIGDFESLGIEATDKVIDQMIAKLQTAKSKLVEDDADPTKIAAVNAEIERLNKLKEQNNNTSQSRSLKEWQDMEKQLKDCCDSFGEIGDAIGGVAGEAISAAGEIAASTLSAVSGITTLVQSSSAGIKTATNVAATSMSTVEKASVILAIISAVIQVAMKIASMFDNTDEQREKIEGFQEALEQLKWEASNPIAVQIESEYGSLERTAQAMQQANEEQKKLAEESGKTGLALVSAFRGAEAQARATTSAISSLSTSMIEAAKGAKFETQGEAIANTTSKINNLAAQNVELQKSINAESKVKAKKRDNAAIVNWSQQIQENWAEAAELMQEATEGIFGGTADTIAKQLSDAMFEAFEDGVDAAQAWGDATNEIVKDVMKNVLINDTLSQQVDAIMNKYKANWFNTSTGFVGWDAVLADADNIQNELTGLYSGFNAAFDQLDPDMKALFFGDDVGDDVEERTASSSSGITASQESVDENNGRLTAIQGYTFNIAENVLRMRELAEISAEAIRPSIVLGSSDNLSSVASTGDDIRYLRENAGKMLATVMGIKDDTAHLDPIRKDIAVMKTALNNMEIKGIKIKR